MVKEELADVLSEFARTSLTNFPIQRILDHLVERVVDVKPITGAGVTRISETLDPQYVATANASALRAIIQLAHGLGVTVISEGVETTDQHQQLTTLGSDFCQGVYFAHPMLAQNLESLIHTDNAANPHLPVATTVPGP